MNQHLQNILDIIRQAGHMNDEEKAVLIKEATATDREFEIEAALEIVRSRALAMHQSEEIKEVVKAVVEQITALNIEMNGGVSLVTFSPESKDLLHWLWIPEQFNEPFKAHLSYFDHIIYNDCDTARQKSLDLVAKVYSGREKDDYFKHLINYSGFKDIAEDVKTWVMQQPYFGFSFAIQKHSGIFLNDYSGKYFSAETNDILIRFSKVFEQAYIRFLDLQKAEAQGREAQIEAALERVRSQTMAMQKSEELKDVIQVVYDQFAHLNIHVDHTGFIIDYKKRDDMYIWLADKQAIPFEVSIPYFDSPHWNSFREAKEKGINFFSNYLDFEVKNKFYRDLFQLIPGVPEETINYYLSCPALAGSTVLLDTIGLYIENFSGTPYTDEENDILMRFGKVFQQTFTRFNDLQKAEAQAREAQIETGLERVRSRTMGMQKSDELKEVIQVVYDQFVLLDMKVEHTGFIIDYKKSDDMHIWLADMHAVPFEISIPYFDSPHWNSFREAKEEGSDFFANHLDFDEKNRFYQLLFQHIPGVPEEVKNNSLTCPALAISTVLLDTIGLYIENYSGTAYTDEENQVLMRFGKVFQQTFTRFNDLQKAEAQALEAFKQASVDRVRAEIASMRSTSDLERITPLIWNELTTLGVPFIRCGVFIIDEEQQKVQTYLYTEGKTIASFESTFNQSNIIIEALPYWRRKEIYKTHWDEAAFLEQARNLVEQGVLASNEKYLAEHRPGDLYLHFLPFLQGMLYVGDAASLNGEHLQLVQALADAFSTAYARYEDFNKLEAAKLRVDQTLVDLKQAQKQLIQSEKMASLGELTAGIAHEIQNPLNFVNNFSDVNKELLNELNEEIEKGNYEEVKLLAADILGNSEKINQHGKRADAIVKGMLQHSRKSDGVNEPTDINALCNEYLRLSYHGLRAKDKNFNSNFTTDFDNTIGYINIVPQDIGRVILNLVNNAFYATNEKRKTADENYHPLISIQTKKIGNHIEIAVSDNGNGIPTSIREKIFQPFFTTKPTGQGTGLGLSLSYDIVKAHGGELKVESLAAGGQDKDAPVTEFIIRLPV